jgi:hypothetical protein
MEPGEVLAPLEVALLADVELVLEDELEELGVAEAIGGGLLEADGQIGAEAGKAQLAEGGVDLGGHEGKRFCRRTSRG